MNPIKKARLKKRNDNERTSNINRCKNFTNK